MRGNGTFRQANITRILKAAKAAGFSLEIELEGGKAKITLANDDNKAVGVERASANEDLKHLV